MKFGRQLVKIIMLIANLVVAFIMIMTLVGSAVSPEKLILPAYTSLFFPVTIAINLFFIVFWLLARNWMFLISFIIIIIAAPHIGNTVPVHFKKPKNIETGKNITILSYNTKMNDAVLKHTKEKPNKVIQYILETDADIVCIQEFAVGHKETDLTHEDVLRIFSNYKYKQIVYKLSQGWCKYGMAIFSKFPIINKDTIHFISDSNISIYSDIVVNNDTIRLISNHLESNRLTEQDKAKAIELKNNFDADNLTETTLQLSRKLGVAYRVRAAQADYLADFIKKSPYKLIAVGDLNDVPSSYVYTQVKGKNLKDAFAETGTGIGWTFNQFIYRFRIDYVLHDPAFQVVDFHVEKFRASDHYPIHCNINIPNK
ncbi:MAG TPA: endonuclease/exonuclease/phosphatase family protein [Paludibacter sp.]|nr:endonuclease/exonuclease/phosphatase family protein [Paludibacter sp.]